MRREKNFALRARERERVSEMRRAAALRGKIKISPAHKF